MTTHDLFPGENHTDYLNSTLQSLNSTEISGNLSDFQPNDNVSDVDADDVYWQRVLPILRHNYVEAVYGEHYELVFFVTLVVCIIGYITNTFNVVVLSGTQMTHSMNLFLLVLSTADTLHITTQFSHVVHYLSGFKLFPGYEWVLFYQVNTYFETMFLYVTNWMAVAIGAWRFLAITWPLHSRDWCSKGRAQKVIVVIFVLAAFLASPVFFVLTYEKVHHRSRDIYDKTFSEFAMANDMAFMKFYWVLLLFMGFVPCLLLALLTFGLFKNLYQAKAKHRGITNTGKTNSFAGSHRTTIMLTIILLLYILSNFPDGCLFLVSLATDDDQKSGNRIRNITDIIRIFMISNNSLSFFIYYGLGEGFRTRFNSIFCCCLKRKKSASREGSGKTTSSEITRSRVSLNSCTDVDVPVPGIEVTSSNV